jgi:hypothetical protein
MATAALERKVCFSDESRFLLQRADGRARVHRGRNERLPVCSSNVPTLYSLLKLVNKSINICPFSYWPCYMPLVLHV